MIKGKRILITGGGGFIGTALAQCLAPYNKVTRLDLSFDPHSRCTGDDTILVRTNVLDRESLIDAVLSSQIIIHAAARVGVKEVHDDVVATLETNYTGTANVLNIALGNPRCERIVYLSTSEIFGINAYNIRENGTAVFSNSMDIRWCYGVGKLAAEHLAMGYHRQSGLPVTVVRPFNVFGEGRTGNHAILRFITCALCGRDIIVYGEGEQVRAWCHIDDFCDAVLRILDTDDAIGKIFNIGNPSNAVSILSLAETVKALCSSHSKIVFQPPPFTDINIRIPDIALAKKVLGFTPKIGLREGLQRTIEWVRRLRQ